METDINERKYDYEFTSMMTALLFMRRLIEDGEFDRLIEMRVGVDGRGYFYSYHKQKTFVIKDMQEVYEYNKPQPENPYDPLTDDLIQW